MTFDFDIGSSKISRRPLNAHMEQVKPYKAEILKASFLGDTMLF